VNQSLVVGRWSLAVDLGGESRGFTDFAALLKPGPSELFRSRNSPHGFPEQLAFLLQTRNWIVAGILLAHGIPEIFD
jgi:hypothetical protein